MHNIDIVKDIWSLSTGRYASIATIDRSNGGTKFQELLYPKNEFARTFEQGFKMDYYFSALTFCGQQRTNTNFCGSKVLFADLDGSDPRDLPGYLQPTIAWETSSASFQAVWFLRKEVGTYEDWASLNKRLTITTGADRGGWMGSKLLRIPGTINWKRTDPEQGEMLWENGPTYDREHLEKVLDPLKPALRPTERTGVEKLELDADFRKELISQNWPQLSLKVRAMLMKEQVRDRSLHIIHTIYQLKKEGFGNVEIFYMIWWAPWNKWRPNQAERLWDEIESATL